MGLFLRKNFIPPTPAPLAVRLLLSSELIGAARALLRWEQRDLAIASAVSLPTIKRLESQRAPLVAHESTVVALKNALGAAGIEFI